MLLKQGGDDFADVGYVAVCEEGVEWKAEDVGSGVLGLREIAFGGAEVLAVPSKQMKGGVVDGEFQAEVTGFADQGVAGNGEGLGAKDQLVEVEGGLALGMDVDGVHGVQVGEGGVVGFFDGDAPGVHFLYTIQLAEADGGLEVGHVGFKTWLQDIVKGGFLHFHALPSAFVEAVAAEDADAAGNGFVLCEDHTAFGSGDVFGRVKRKGTGVSEGAQGFACKVGFECMGTILDDGEVVLAGQVHNGGHVAGVASHVDGQDGPGARGDASGDGLGGDVHGAGGNVGEDGLASCMEDAVGGGDKGHGGGDDFVTGLQIKGLQGEVDACGATAHGHRGHTSSESGNPLLKFCHTRACGQPAGTKGGHDLCNLGIGDVGPVVWYLMGAQRLR